MKPALLPALLLALAALLTGCGRGHDDHRAETAADRHAGHTHAPKHGGVAVPLGDEVFHLEFTRGTGPGQLQAYFLDGHMEEYIRSEAPSFAATATGDGRAVSLVFTATTNAATGEKPGDCSLFEARLDPPVAGPLVLTIPAVTVKGRTFTQLTVTLPPAP